MQMLCISRGNTGAVRDRRMEALHEISGHNGHSLTPLMITSCEGYYEVCELLFNHNADINATEKCALHLAAIMGHKDVVKLLCKRNADISHLDSQGVDAINTVDCIVKKKGYESIGCTAKQFERIAEILCVYDINLSSHCKNGMGLLRHALATKKGTMMETVRDKGGIAIKSNTKRSWRRNNEITF